MKTAMEEETCQTARKDLQAFFDECIERMNPKELARFEKKANKIVQRIKQRARSSADESHETAQSGLKASRV